MEDQAAGTRTEVDLLGERSVPADAYYGVHTVRALENFQISGDHVGDHPTFVRSLAMVKKAEALANGDLHVLSPRTVDVLVRACDEILVAGRCLDQFPLDVFQGGAGTSVNMNANEVIANLALELLGRPKGEYSTINPNDDVNKSQSTNDTYPTALRLAIVQMVEPLREQLRLLADDFRTVGARHLRTLKMGRTQLQDAVPMSVGQEFNAFAVTVEEEVRHLAGVSRLLLEVNLGATAIGTGLNTPDGFPEVVVRRLAEVSGLDVVPAPNLIEATSDAGAYIAVHAGLKRVAAKVSKIANDLRLLSSGPRAGLGEIHLPERQAGSSIMPAKVNPVIPEVVNQVCFKVIGNDVTVTLAAEAGQLQLNVMEPVIAQCLFESVELLTRAVRTLREKCVQGITVDEERTRADVMNSIGIVTALNDLIGHHEGDLVGQECARTGKSVREVVLERGLLTEDEVDEALSVDNLLHPRYMGRTFSDRPEAEIVP